MRTTTAEEPDGFSRLPIADAADGCRRRPSLSFPAIFGGIALTPGGRPL